MNLNIRTDNVKKVRNSGLIPGVIYGKEFKAISVEADALEFKKVLAENGKTKVFEIDLKGEKHKVYIKDFQSFLLTKNEIMHFDLQKVQANEIMYVKIPISLVNKEEIEKKSLLVSMVMTELPCEFAVENGISEIEVDLSGLELNDAIYVKDLIVPKDVKVNVDEDEMVLVIRDIKMAEEEETDSDLLVPEEAEEEETEEE
ncbi:MAG: 50S ribosomal protein L25 [Bacilli bacterium]